MSMQEKTVQNANTRVLHYLTCRDMQVACKKSAQEYVHANLHMGKCIPKCIPCPWHALNTHSWR